MTVTIAKWTIEEYHAMIATGILDNRRVELLRGKLSKCHRKKNLMLILVAKVRII